MQNKKFRKERGMFLVEGVKSVEALIQSPFEIAEIYTTEYLDFLKDVDNSLVQLIKQNELERISGLRSPNKILAVAKIPKAKPIDWNQNFILILDGINDPGNVGTIIRTAKWFGVDTIICSQECADAYDGKVVQSTMGALFHVNLRYEDLSEIMNDCKSNGFRIMGAAMDGDSVYECSNSTKTALVIGSESHGISKGVLEKCNSLVTIPNNETTQKVESLNAGIATSIILSELTRPK
ncbi:MAG: RNA methyltransferase [Flavobacteriales bacterium]|nr:RNA methyltransferase [Flavobacteriales bacterium]